MAEVSESTIQRWVEHAQNYIQTVLAPRCRSLQSEVAIGIDWSKGDAVIYPSVTGRDYPKDGRQHGTADLVAILHDGTLLVGDWKTGGTDGAQEQLASLVCGLHRALSGSVGPEASRTLCLKVDEEGVWPEEKEISKLELDNHWDAMRFAWEDIGKRTEKVPGIHCTQLYCPHLAYCDAVTGLVQDAANADSQSGRSSIVQAKNLVRKYRMTDSPKDAYEAGYTMERVTAARRQLNYYTEALKDYVKAGGQVLSGDYEWKETGAGYRWSKIRR